MTWCVWARMPSSYAFFSLRQHGQALQTAQPRKSGAQSRQRGFMSNRAFMSKRA